MVETVGWTGAALVLCAYAMLSAKKLPSDSYAYHGMNIAGSICLGLYAYWKDASATLLVNVVWMFIGIAAVMMLRARAKRR